jgi:BirA family biotin operon repressor/biotin-[acetyl-CoA-carboxylase] ligase
VEPRDAPPEDLHPGKLLRILEANRICRSIVLFDVIDSTNGAAMRAAGSGASERVLFLAEEQRRGRGRAGRSWVSAPGKDILFSLLLRPPRDAEGLTPLLAVATVRALAESCGEVMVKWPNDIYIGAGKAAGILAQSKEGVVVLGMGLNVNETAEDFPIDLRGIATSLRIESGRPLARGEVLVRILNELDHCYARWCDFGLSPFVEELGRRMLYTGEPVVLESGNGRFVGVMRGLTEDGRLRLEVEGRERVFASGDLSLRGRPQ